jgi:hypothetical protein
MDQKFGKLFVFRAEARQGAVVAAHPAVGTIFSAKVRDFDHGTHKNLFAKLDARRCGGSFMQCRLRCAIQGEFRFSRKISVT